MVVKKEKEAVFSLSIRDKALGLALFSLLGGGTAVTATAYGTSMATESVKEEVVKILTPQLEDNRRKAEEAAAAAQGIKSSVDNLEKKVQSLEESVKTYSSSDDQWRRTMESNIGEIKGMLRIMLKERP